uniref:Olfactory receptor family 10 subfamily Q member 1 n=1 Tax=Sphaeramia orbicularis TaxID=375764 RepID=A0A672YCS0_9TELE
SHVLLLGPPTLSVPICFMQMFFFIQLGITTRSILTVMAYDRYLAICNPLRYTTIMTQPVRRLLIAGSWGFSTFCTMPSATLTWTRPFCGPNMVQHFWCDISTLRRLMCINTRVDNILALTFALVALGTTGLLILTSYILIGISVSKMGVAERWKAIGTCAAHLIVVTVSYTAASVVYISYRVGNFSSQVRPKAVVYAALTPCLNPMIYSLRNKELQEAIRRMFGRLRASAVSSGKDVTTVS